jgi:hypothetical protein
MGCDSASLAPPHWRTRAVRVSVAGFSVAQLMKEYFSV